MIERALEYARSGWEGFLRELEEFLRIPTVSAQPTHTKDMERGAEWVAQALRSAGLQNVRIFPTGPGKGHPVVYGDWIEPRPNLPTILVYGHYDVQPPEPLEKWTSPPFDPQVREGKIFARGATDDKGQIFCHIKGVESYLKSEGRLPVNVKFLIEGEEELGSPHLPEFIGTHRDLLRSDVVLISDSAMWDENHPSLVWSLRGLCYFYVHARAANADLHSGTFGGAVPNALEWLARLLASAKDPSTGKVLIPGFYNRVRTSPKEREALRRLPFDERKYRRSLGLRKLFVEKGWTPIESTTIRPTFEIHGVWGGYIGEGQKTVLPSEAHAKVSMRLVADQDPKEISRLFRSYVRSFESRAPGVTFEVEPVSGSPPVRIPLDHPALEAGKRALEKAFPGKEVVFSAEGGSIPVVSTFLEVLQAPSVLMGFGLHDENLHAPNEHIRLENVRRGIEASIHFLDEIARVQLPSPPLRRSSRRS